MRYQVEIDNEVVAVFQYLSWAKKWAEEYANYVSLDGNLRITVTIAVVDVLNDTVYQSWGK